MHHATRTRIRVSYFKYLIKQFATRRQHDKLPSSGSPQGTWNQDCEDRQKPPVSSYYLFPCVLRIPHAGKHKPKRILARGDSIRKKEKLKTLFWRLATLPRFYSRYHRLYRARSEERRVGKECRSRWS